MSNNVIIGRVGKGGEIEPVESSPHRVDDHIKKLKKVVTDAEEAGKNLTQAEIQERQANGHVDAIRTIIIPPEEK
jgi:predicted ATP-dependent serine protease